MSVVLKEFSLATVKEVGKVKQRESWGRGIVL